MHTSTTLSLVRIVWGSDGKKRGAAAKLTKAAVCGAISFGPAISLVVDVYKKKIGQRQGCYTPSIFPGVCRDDAAHECCSIPRRHQHRAFASRSAVRCSSLSGRDVSSVERNVTDLHNRGIVQETGRAYGCCSIRCEQQGIDHSWASCKFPGYPHGTK